MHDRLPGSIGPAPEPQQAQQNAQSNIEPTLQGAHGVSAPSISRQAAYDTAMAAMAGPSKSGAMPPPPPPNAAASGTRGKRGRKQAPAPLDFASPQTDASGSSAAAGDPKDKQMQDKAKHVQPSPTTPARFLFEMPKTAGLSGWSSIGSMPGAMGAMMTPLRPDFLGGLDLNIDF
jgi:hypothetical protein